MAVGGHSSMGLVIRTRAVVREASLMVQVKGMDPRMAANAAEEANDLLTQALAYQDPGEITNIMQSVPLVCGSVMVARGRLRVTYRIMGQLLVLVVTRHDANALLAVHMLEKCVRIMTTDFRSVDLSADRFIKRYQEVYMAMSVLMASSGSIPAVQALSEGRAHLEVMHHAPTAAAAAATGKRSAATQQQGAAPDGAEQLPGTSQGVSAFKARRRTLASQAAQLPIQFGFPTGDSMKHVFPAGGFDVDQSAAKKAALPFTAKHQFALMPDQADDVFDALKAGSKTAAAASAGGSPLDGLLGPAVGAKKQDGPKKGEDPFAFVEAALSTDKKAGSPAGPPPPPTPPTPLLRLVETWKADVKGSAVVRAGHTGEVSWLPEVTSTQLPVVGFSLQYVVPASHTPQAMEAVHDALQAVRALPQVVQPQWPEGYLPAEGLSDTGGEADLQGMTASVAASKQLLHPVLARYSIPMGRGPVKQPVLVRLDSSIQPVATGPETAVMLGVQLQLDPSLSQCTSSVEVKLHVPSLYDLPSRARPRGAQMDGSRRVLKWLITAPTTPLPATDIKNAPAVCSLDQLCAGPYAFSAAFLVSGSVAAAKGVLRSVLAEIEVRGKPGTTLSGVMLRQHGFVGPNAPAAAAMCGWKVMVNARHG